MPILSSCPAKQACSLHTRKVETVLCYFRMSPKPLLLDELKSCVFGFPLHLLNRAYQVLVSLVTYIA